METDPDRVRRECALYRRWLVSVPQTDADSALIYEVILEMLADLMVAAILRR